MQCNNCKQPISSNDTTILSNGDHGYVIHADCTIPEPTTQRYTIETLTPINGEFLGEHYHLTSTDTARVNSLIDIIEARLTDSPTPQDGDMLICELPDGTVKYERAHIEKASWADKGELTGCTQAYVPHITKEGKCNASGGYWFAFKANELEHVGTVSKMFWTWGHCGMCAHGGVNFNATVNYWKLVDTKNRIY